MYIFLPVLGGGQDKPAWTACPPGVKITMVGGKISRDSLPPGGGGGGQANRSCLAPQGASCPGGQDKLGHRLTKCHFLVHSNMHNAPYIQPRHDLILVL